MVCELLAWMQMLALADPARCWGTQAGTAAGLHLAGQLVRGDCLQRLHLAAAGPSPHISPPRSSAWRPSGLADQPKPSLRTEEPAMACKTRPPGATGRDRVGQIKHPANASATTKFAKSSGLEHVFGVDDCIPHDGFFTRTMVSPVCYSR